MFDLVYENSGWRILTDFGTSIREGSLPDADQGSGAVISIAVEQKDYKFRSLVGKIEPVTG